MITSSARARGRLGRVAAALALAPLVAVPLGGHAVAAPAAAGGGSDIAALSRQLDAATAAAKRASDALLAAQAKDVYLRVALDRIADARRVAREQLARQAQDLYEATQSDPVSAYFADVRTPGQQLLDAAAGRSGGDAATLFDRATREAATLEQLTRRADALRAGLARQAAAAYAAQDRARAILAQARAAYAAEQANARIEAALAGRQARLDAMSTQVTLAVAVDAGPAGRAALAHQQPVLAALTAAGSGYPAGYRPTGQVITGESSWYGPGFAGNPTASGAPYDPEQLTCAMLAVPLGTVVHVTDLADGRSVNMLVNDRGPYADGRVLDSSHAGAVALGFDGVAPVRIEVLAPAG